MIEITAFASEHPGWITLWLVLVWFIVGEFLDREYGERF